MGGDRVTGTGTGPVWRPTTAPAAGADVASQATADDVQPKVQGDQVTRNGTIGDYVEDQIKQAGQSLKEDAQVAAITAVAGPVVAVIEARHLSSARERIAKLPMDPDGKWKQEAATILAEEQAAAKQEIISLPGTAIQGVKDGANAVAQSVSDGVTYAQDKANQVWGSVSGAAGQAWDFAKAAVPKAFGELTTDAGVAAISLNPLGAGPSAVIVGNHMANAYNRIMKLPMDPDGKWKIEAAKIVAEEQGAAKKEILALPGKAYQGVVDTATTVYEGALSGLNTAYQAAQDGVVAAGHGIAGFFTSIEHGIEAEVHREVDTVKHEVDAARHGVGGLFKKLGSWISGD